MTDHLRDTIIPFDDGEFQSPFIGFGDWTGGFEDQPGRNTYSFGGCTGPQIHPEKPAEPAADPRIAAQNAFQQFRDSTGYQFRLGEGQKGLERSAAARGGLLSGAAIKAAADYGQNTASGEFGNYFNYLMNIANGGQSALNNTGQAGQNFASGAANAYGNIGNAMSSGYTNQANAWGNAMNGVGTAFGDWYRGSQAGNRADTTSPTGQVTGWV